MKRWYLLKAREASGKEQTDISEALDTTQQWVSRVENGSSNKRGLSIRTCIDLAKVYGIGFGEMCAEEAKWLAEN